MGQDHHIKGTRRHEAPQAKDQGAVEFTTKPHHYAQAERPIGASAGEILGQNGKDPKGATNIPKTDPPREAKPMGASTCTVLTGVDKEASLMGYTRGNVAVGEGALSSEDQGATNPRRTHTLADPTPRSPIKLLTTG